MVEQLRIGRGKGRPGGRPSGTRRSGTHDQQKLFEKLGPSPKQSTNSDALQFRAGCTRATGNSSRRKTYLFFNEAGLPSAIGVHIRVVWTSESAEDYLCSSGCLQE